MKGCSRTARHREAAALSVRMLREVLDGATYEAVAQRFGVSRTAVERRIKSIAVQLTQAGGVDGLSQEAAGFVRRLRSRRDAIYAALERFTPGAPSEQQCARVLSEAEVALGALRIKRRARRTWHDLSLYYLLFATGLRPLEVARLQLRDYLHADGSVRRESELPAQAAINGRARPLYFSSGRLDEALGAYLDKRVTSSHAIGRPDVYRGLDPASGLFLGPAGEPYPIASHGDPAQERHICRALLEIYRRLFRYADIDGMSTQSARLTLMSRMYARCADEDQVGVILGIADRYAVRELLPRPKPRLADLLDEVV